MDHFSDKGRLDDFMLSKFRVMVVNPEIEIGLLGAEEKARREFLWDFWCHLYLIKFIISYDWHVIKILI